MRQEEAHLWIMVIGENKEIIQAAKDDVLYANMNMVNLFQAILYLAHEWYLTASTPYTHTRRSSRTRRYTLPRADVAGCGRGHRAVLGTGFERIWLVAREEGTPQEPERTELWPIFYLEIRHI